MVLPQLWSYNAKMKKGKIIPNGVVLEKHEYQTVLYFTELGIDVELVPKSNNQGEHSPDIRMNRLFWEMKAPKGEGGSLMKNTLQKAARQSENVIIDLRRAKRHQAKCLSEIKREFNNSKRLKRIKIVTKKGNIVELLK